MTDADLLREAAALMRRDAAAEAVLREGDPYYAVSGEASRYERAWHPAVALTVADWLNTCARICDGDAQHGIKLASTHGAIEVARAYLGRDGG